MVYAHFMCSMLFLSSAVMYAARFAHRRFDFAPADDSSASSSGAFPLPPDVELCGEQAESFCINGGLFIGPMSYLRVRHGLGAPDGGCAAADADAAAAAAAAADADAGADRISCFTLVLDVLFEQVRFKNQAVTLMASLTSLQIFLHYPVV